MTDDLNPVPPVGGRYGAPMGRASIGQFDEGERIYLYNINLSDGYDDGGAYWGHRPRGVRLWCALSESGTRQYFDTGYSVDDALRFLRREFDVQSDDVEFREQTWTLYWHYGSGCECEADGGGSYPSEYADSYVCDCGDLVEVEYFEGETETRYPVTGD